MATYWIDPTSGDDANNGTTKALAVKTFSDVFGLVSDGDSITVVDGTHTLSASGGGICTTQITIESEGGTPKNCIIDGDSTYWFTIHLNADITVKNIQFKDLADKASIEGRAGVIFADVSNITITATNLWFIGVDVSGTNESGCFYFTGASGSTLSAIGCVFKNLDSDYYNQGAIVARGCSVVFIVANCVSVQSTSVSNLRFIVAAYLSSISVIMKNSIFYTDIPDNATILGEYAGTVVSESFSYNCYHSAGAGSITLGSFTDGGNNITTDPKILDIANLDFRLRQDSPCLDNGTII